MITRDTLKPNLEGGWEWAAVELLLEVEGRIAAMAAGESCRPEFFDLLYMAAKRIGPTESFYACLFDETDETLYFPCNWEGDSCQACEIKALGKGPTSWVVRNRRTYASGEDRGQIQHSANRFGDVSRESLSAIHAPMLAADRNGRERLHGVLSMQSYHPNVYNSRTVQLFEWLARRAAAALQRDRDIAEARAGEHSRYLWEQSNEFNRSLKEITRRAEEVNSLLRGVENDGLRDAVTELCRACYKSQSKTVIHAFQPDPAPKEPVPLSDPFLPLTRQERKVLLLLSRHRTYVQIAVELSIEVSTVKSHVANIIHKLGVSGRGEAAELAEPFRHKYE